MKLTVLGATGATGTHMVRRALAEGHRVTAVVRDPARVAGDIAGHPGLDVVVGDVTRPESLADPVAGADAVVSLLGPRDHGPSTVCQDGARSAIAAMEPAGVRRLVAISVAGIHTAGDGPFTKHVVKPLLGRALRHEFADARAMEQVIEACELDWTIVNPPRLTRGRRTGYVRRRLDRVVPGRLSISRADLADVVLDTVADIGTYRHRVFVGTASYRHR